MEKQARDLVRRMPGHGFGWKALGGALQEQGRDGEALVCLQRALALLPEDVATWINAGVALQRLNRHEEAEGHLRKALALAPEFTRIHWNLAHLLIRRRRFDDAASLLREVTRLQPADGLAHGWLGFALFQQGRMDEAEAAYRQALRLLPAYAEGHYNLGVLLAATGRLPEAEAAYREAIRLQPEYALAYHNLGVLLTEMKRPLEAEQLLRISLHLHPDRPETMSNLASVLMVRCRLDEAAALCRRALALQPDCAPAMFNLVFGALYHPQFDVARTFALYREYDARFVQPLRALWREHANSRDPERRLKVGYVSPDFRNHSIRGFVEPLLARRDERFERFAYAELAREDAVSERYKGYVDHWIPTRGMTHEALAERIRADGIDLLVDLAGHTNNNRLPVFARKPAPVSVTWLYGFTTGVSAIDYALTDAITDPPGAEAFYLEQVWRIPPPALVYRPQEEAGEVSALPALTNGHVTFGSFGRSIRMNDRVVRVWSEILRQTPATRLVIFSGHYQDPGMREELYGRFASHGIDRQRLEIGFTSSPWDKLRAIDIGLDCFPLNSGITLAEMLYMGLPAVSMAEREVGGGLGAMLLRMLGRDDWIARDEAEYVKIAVELASDLPRLATLRAGLRNEMKNSPLMDEAGFVAKVEAAYREMWRRWCAS
ncbi:MAG: tetratricopeptide repeat protein [Magnetococcales bacterium]|nr:tetratricopeptide repeat protein [Magnetococcales bacterium]